MDSDPVAQTTQGNRSPDGRWPESVYGAGSEPDYRFSFANERTFLAWIRTALALLAAGVAIDAVDLPLRAESQHLLAILLTVTGALCAVIAWIRWSRAERAMRRSAPLPGFGLGALFTGLVVCAAVVVIASVA
ncbi:MULTISPECIES: YidH family protein [unclassified Nocardioides]|uniref:YidH family protein n=1 Tax=unclassified Nocardioides TaxID=2615069 RepID=UPI0006F641FE|nr:MULTISPECIES: DUF202 domain-containing protein [unclassified Nocardioides]KQY54264.1 hypothetical protein ASD30_18795 [Nocardioides sp. Root140]KQZ74885.1 hypothetical protein ASD66_00390 [Nocardioides sp. Root151]KRF10419.1 hypothetical protein ASH02_20125 [Nocardioides sp. Soil796]